MTKRNMLLASTLTLLACAACSSQAPVETLSDQDKGTPGEWMMLFDGSSLDHWKSTTRQENVSACWQIKDGELVCTPRENRPSGVHASLLTREQYSDFEFCFEFKLDKPTQENASNSGVKYFVYPLSELGLEYQLYARVGEVEGPHATGDLYDLFCAKGASLRPFDQWNEARIVSKGTHCEHWLNGVKVLEYERGGEAFRAAIAKSKFKNHPNFGERESGQIMLQDHGGRARFRNVKIREF